MSHRTIYNLFIEVTFSLFKQFIRELFIIKFLFPYANVIIISNKELNGLAIFYLLLSNGNR